MWWIWYWNTKPVLPPTNGGNGFGIFYFGAYQQPNIYITSKYTFSNGAVQQGSNLLGSTTENVGAAGNSQLAVIGITNIQHRKLFKI